MLGEPRVCLNRAALGRSGLALFRRLSVVRTRGPWLGACSLPAPRAPKHLHRDNAGGDPKCHADDAVEADAAAGDGASEQGHGCADRPTRHRGRREAAGWRSRAILLSHATPSVFHQRHIGRVLRSS